MYAFVHQGKAYTPGKVDPPVTAETAAEWNESLMAVERKRIADRLPLVVYPAGTRYGDAVTLWPGEKVGFVVRHSFSRSGFYHSEIHSFRWRDLSGHEWYGRGPGAGMYLRSRPCK